MPGLVALESTTKKRKRVENGITTAGVKSRKAAKLDSGDAIKPRILQLEETISYGEYSGLHELSTIVEDATQKSKNAILAAVSECRAFCKLIASERLVKSKDMSDQDLQTISNLRSSLQAFVRILQTWIGSADSTKENTSVTLLMRIVKEEALQDSQRADQAWRGGSIFVGLVEKLILTDNAEGARQFFVEKYVEEHDDVRYHTFNAVKQVLNHNESKAIALVDNALDLLSRIEGIPESQEQLEDWYGRAPEGKKCALTSFPAHLKVAQEAWMSIFRARLTQDHRKRILGIMKPQILPWFATKLEILADFLTDSFNSSGSTAVLALSSLYDLITRRNIDYPDFYTKLYSLLDEDILHSKHRSQFLRLLDSCLASSHLPAALVASFIKKLARLSLQAPPGAIVWFVPWTYNLLRQHPTCTFMLHRAEHSSHLIYQSHPKPAETGMTDPFDMKQTDPMLTHAIDSSLWEMETLQTHYHPNVATLSSIISEQFTKREYQLEDFLDHTYTTLLEGELARELKKEPVVEWEIPKHIVTADDEQGMNPLGDMLQAAIDAL